MQKNEVKEYHTRLSEIFKRYLSRKTNTINCNLTSDEILMELNEYDLERTTFCFCKLPSHEQRCKICEIYSPQNESEKCLEQTKEMITAINKNLNKKPESDI